MNAPRSHFLSGRPGLLATAGREAPGALRRPKTRVPGAAPASLTIPLASSVLALLSIVATHDGHRSEADAIWHLVAARARNIGLVDGAARPAEKPGAAEGVEPCAVGGIPAPEGASSSLPSSGAGYFLLTVPVVDSDMLLLRLVGAHERLEDEAALVSKLVAERAAEIGIARMADVTDLQGGEAVSRVAHNHEVASSSLAPATNCVSACARVPDREGYPPVALPEPPGPP